MKLCDAHFHIGKDRDGFAHVTLKLAFQVFERNNINFALCIPLDQINDNAFLKINERLLKVKDRRILPCVRINPHLFPRFKSRYLKQMEQAACIKLHPKSQNFSLLEIDEVLECCEDLHKPVLVHTDSEIAKQIPPLVKKFKEITFIFAHPRSVSIFSKVLRRKNVFIDTTKIDHSTLIYYAKLNHKKILWGTDFPYSLPSIEYYKIIRAKPIGLNKLPPLSAKEKEDILYYNFLRLFA